MKSYSQAGQDIFARLILGENHKGFFVDVGCANEQFSNTLSLEQEGWTGLLFDINPKAATDRKSPFTCCDATKTKFNLPSYVDYLSLDIDEGTLEALKNIDLTQTRFGVITIEHDAYRFGDNLRPAQRAILKSAGYEMICSDVNGTANAPFEDWWVSPELASKAEKFRCHDKVFTEIIYQLKA